MDQLSSEKKTKQKQTKTQTNQFGVLIMSFELFESLGLSSKLCPTAMRANHFLRFC